ncbi:MAG: SBBP repeat-containing protein [Ignavibacteria bacterium]|nr:SBBP repeat-containing protein [Ignavibacteria bacterium]
MQRYNSSGNHNDYVTDMAIDKSGNVYLTGYVQVNDTDQNFITIKYNTQGIEQWVRYYDGPDHREDKAGSIAVDDSGNVIVTGYSYSYSEFDDILTIKYNSNGDSLWTKKFTGIGHVSDRPNAMTLDKFGNIYITGSGIGVSSVDIITLAYDKMGIMQWARYYNSISNVYDVGYDIIINKFNIVYVSGGSFGIGGVILRYDLDGNEFPVIESSVFFGYKILLDMELNILLGFETYGGLSTRYDIATAKIDSVGKLNWIRSYHNNSTNNNDYFKDMCLDIFGNVTVTGISGNSGELAWDIATIKYNTNGDTLWINRYNPAHNSNDEPSSISSDKYGNSYVTGSSDSGFFGKMITIKYSPTGVREWIAYYNNGNPFTYHSGSKIFADTSGSLYVTGRSQNNQGNIDIATIKYSVLTNISFGSTSIPNQYVLYQNYPNPFNPRTTIKYELPAESYISLKIYNTLGVEIKTLVNEKQNSGKFESVFDGSEFSSGVYFYSLFIDNYKLDTKKLILLK